MNKHRRALRSFTLIELLLVMVILAVLAAIVVPRFSGKPQEAKQRAAQTQIKAFKTALATYEVECDQYPTTAQGLNALMQEPTSDPKPAAWKGPYLDGELPKDPWGNEFIYRYPGTQNANGYDLVCVGPDGQEGTDDDIQN